MPVSIARDFTILYASQTGQAEAISEELFERSFKEGFTPARYCLSQIEKKFSIEKEKCVVLVCSTTGEGEPPDTALKFVRRLKKKTLSSRHLQTLSYTILGLGDSNYTNFCNCAKNIEKRFEELSASSFYETGYADDAVGLEEVVEPWFDGLFPALRNLLKIEKLQDCNSLDVVEPFVVVNPPESINTAIPAGDMLHESDDGTKATLKLSVPPLSVTALKVPSAAAPFLQIKFVEGNEVNENCVEYPNADTPVGDVFVTSARRLTKNSCVKKALEVELDIKGFTFAYEPGDSFGIVCENRKVEVDYLIERLTIEHDADRLMTLEVMENTQKKSASVPLHVHCPSTLRDIFTRDVDFCAVPRKAFLRMLVDYTTNESEKRRIQELCSTQGTKDYNELVRGKYIGLVQLLKVFESCAPPVERVLEFLPQLLPREYSIASCATKNPGHLKFVFNVIELPEFQLNKRFGLCTSWLDTMTACMQSNPTLEEKVERMQLQDVKVKMYFRRPTSFRFPEDASKPIIMIGPGTGVAPYIGFLEKRDFLKKANPSIVLGTALLFFGCRYQGKDFLYREELLSFKESGILTDLYTSFSRDSQPDGEAHTKYVQDNIRKHKKRVLDLVFTGNGVVFICGDAKHMGRDVTNTFIELIEEYKSIPKIDAIKTLNELREKKQFLEDVWT